MEWTGEAIVLTARRLGESNVILEIMSESHGRHAGVVRGGKSRRLQPALQPGNQVQVTWRARLTDQMGQFSIDPVKSRAAQLMETPLGLHSVQHLAGLLRLLPERDPHPRLFHALSVVLDHMDSPQVAAPLLVRFELELLAELGFGLDLTACAATGRMDDLAYVSPNSGRAVSREAGLPYHDRLLPLPGFLVEGQRQQGGEISFTDIAEGFRLTSFFLERIREAGHDTLPQAPSLSLLRAPVLSAVEKGYREAQPWDFMT
ncbi:DNA repair protein RecO [Roseibium litorale]|uniref:DNA repair protein RecO n=1 Tax=Roseibium litorale TaxID=2803841 RepID=A0ABR9CUY9_9HYPH|nr:DNA repair protein RecO [Roseibium litorale]MBD8894324.1 DNA repair protein RecO [Roseibium litorale]